MRGATGPRCVTEAGCWGRGRRVGAESWVLLLAEQGLRFGGRILSGVHGTAQSWAASDTYRLRRAARPGLRGHKVPGGLLPKATGCPGDSEGPQAEHHLCPPPLPQSVQEFHEDLFPDCAGVLPATDAQAWWAGDSQQVSVTQGVSPWLAWPGAGGSTGAGTATTPQPWDGDGDVEGHVWDFLITSF